MSCFETPKKAVEMKVTFVIASMDAGGAERVLSILANHGAELNWDITLLTFTRGASFFPLHPAIKFSPLGILDRSPLAIQRFLDNFKRLWMLRRAIRKSDPQVVVSFLDQINVHTLLATAGLNLPVIVSERVDPTLHSSGGIWDRLRRWLYPSADRLVSVTQGIDNYFDWLPKENRVVINNPVEARTLEGKELRLPPGVDPDKKWIVAMGRLTHQKGFDLLLEAFHAIADKYTDWQLVILGEGEFRAELETLRDKLELQTQVVFPGCLDDPFSFLMQAKLFVVSSRYEGFVNSLGEAMACGLPAVAFDCPGGPAEIIRHEVDGILVPAENVSALAKGMERLMEGEEGRSRMAANAPDVVQRFSREKILGAWEDVILKVAR
jgi:glycosyltransferase involved in cell wall biosynthesis